MKSKEKFIRMGWVVGILGVNLLLVLGMWKHEPSSQENRRLVEMPQWSFGQEMATYPERFERYVEDNFRLRGAMVSMYSYINVKLLKESVVNTVLVGEDGWLFYGGERITEDLTGLARFDEERLVEWGRFYQQRRQWLEEREVEHVVMIVPNKQSIYPEFLPDEARVSGSPRRWDELSDYLKEKTDVRIVDLHEMLMDEKSKSQVFYKLDTHWNDTGAYLAYVETVKALGEEELVPVAMDEIEVRVGDAEKRELARSLALVDVLEEESKIFEVKDAKAVRVYEGEGGRIWRVYETENEELPVVMVMGDSFSRTKWADFLAENTEKLILVNPPLKLIDEEVIKEYKPDVVIDEVVERRLMNDKYVLESQP